MSTGVAIVGIGNTDYGIDYRTRGVRRTPVELASAALDRALADSGLRASDIDGIVVGRGPFGAGWKGPDIGHGEGHDLYQLARQLVTADLQAIQENSGIVPSWGGAYGSVESIVEAIEAGQANTVVLLYATSHRSDPLEYGGLAGAQMGKDAGRDSYFYHQPWGFTAQAAHWALAFRRHQLMYGSTEEQLGAVAVTLRQYASDNEYAVMRDPVSIEQYLQTRYICRPLRLLDLCLVNDGGVAIILRRTDMSKDMPHVPVLVGGAGYCLATKDVAQLRPLVMEGMNEQIRYATDMCLAEVGRSLADVDHFQVYDASSVLIPLAIEGSGFCAAGEGIEFVQNGNIGRTGTLPVNTSGGMLSESYIHGYNFPLEAVRQLRHEAGGRQVDDVTTSMYCRVTTTEAAVSFYRRGDT
jgi:acetyl-CoA acetyltransferase